MLFRFFLAFLTAAVASTVEPAADARPAPGADVAQASPPVPDTLLPARATNSGVLSDLAVRFRARGEFGGDWARFRPCDASLLASCASGLVPRLQPDVLFSLEAAGRIGGRIEVDVDFDQTRDFLAANRFQLRWLGDSRTLLKRVEVGDVNLALPTSRFLTQGIPSGNFGVRAEGAWQAVTFQAVVAQQQGARQQRAFRLGGVGDGFLVREDTLVVEDAGYVQGQFFLLVDPDLLAGTPHIDLLSLRPGDAPPEVAPGPAPIQLWRMERDPLLRQAIEGYVRADARLAGPGGDEVQESGWFRYLRPGIDYYLHPSGLWVGLRVPLRPDEALAVSYLTVLGDTIGAYTPEQVQNEGRIPGLQLVRAARARHQPGRPTWTRELRQIYRLSASDDVELDAVELSISLGEESGGRTFVPTPDGQRVSLLAVFGLDEGAPFEKVDERALFQPNAGQSSEVGMTGTYLVFPTRYPFLAPPPLQSRGLDAPETRALLGANLNRRIYEADDPFEREGGGLYRLNLRIRTRSSGGAATFSLGAFGILEGSERILFGDRLLRPGVDYLLDTELGTVTLLQPEFLLARSASDQLSVSWEQSTAFRPRPTTLFGGSARVELGPGGHLDVLGLVQAEREIVNRPRFGAEPGASGLFGLRTEQRWRVAPLDRAFEWLLGSRPGGLRAGGGELRMEGELALSLPNPNVSGEAYLDDFDAGDERGLTLLSTAWALGSAPNATLGLSGLPAGGALQFNVASVVPLAWQHSWVERGPLGDSTGVFEGLLPRSDIDRQITIVGAEAREPGLQLSFGRLAGAQLGGLRWRSITTVLSPTGADLSQAEFLDIYIAEGESMTLLFDLGSVSEDAFFVDEASRTGGFRDDLGRPWGLGVLDQEADPLRGEIWDRETDARGVWPEGCRAEPGRVYPIGDPAANCTRGNGRLDTEDLNGNGVLDLEERYARYVVRLDGSSPYLVRTRGQTGTRFQLYRIPLRGGGTLYPEGTLTAADWRAVQFMRITAVGSRGARLTMARMRFVGSRWIKRGGEGIFQGLAGDTLSFGGSLEVTPVSVLTEGPGYVAPPGVLEQLDDPTSALGGRGVELSEKSLAVRVKELAPGARAEVYSRFFQRPRDFLAYSELRVWALARAGDFAPNGDLRVFLKLGSDPENFYLWQVPLTRAGAGEAIQVTDWLPERVLAFDEWFRLRRLAEEDLARRGLGDGFSGADGGGGASIHGPVVRWSADSTFAVVLTDRARAPNLAAVREISLGIWNPGPHSADGEVWFNELRLGGGIQTPGSARSVAFELDGGDLYQARLGYEGRAPRFQSLEDRTAFQGEGTLNLSGTLQLGGSFPETWGVDLPFTVSHARMGRDPLYLQGTDLEAGALPGLRTGGGSETRAALTLRAASPTGRLALDRVLSAVEGRVALSKGGARTITTESQTEGTELSLGFQLRPTLRMAPLVPAPFEPLVRVLFPPAMARALNEADFRWTPVDLELRTGYRGRSLELTRFDRILTGVPRDPGVTDRALEGWLDSRGRVTFHPGGTLTASFELTSVRDLLSPEASARDPRVIPLVSSERLQLAGWDLGWETRRTLTARVGVRPQLTRGVRGEFSAQSRFGSDRNTGLVRFEGGDFGAAGTLLRNARVDRELRTGIVLDPAILLLGGGAVTSPVRQSIIQALGPTSLVMQDGIVAAYVRDAVDPGLRFQLGMGGSEVLSGVDDARAASLSSRRVWTVGSGLRLPATLFLNLNFQSTRVRALDLRSQREGELVSWPDLRFGVASLPLPAEWQPTLQRVSFTSGIQRVSEAVRYGEGLQARDLKDTRLPVDFAIEWGGGVLSRYRGTFLRGRGTDPTGRTGREQVEHGVSLETRLRPRGGLDSPFGSSLRFSLLGQMQALEECRVPAGTQGCIPYLTRSSRSASLGLDTLISGFEVGAQLQWVDSEAFAAFETGFQQFQLSLWGRMEFSAGPVARLDRRRVPTDFFRP